jgi:hypothetical protein
MAFRIHHANHNSNTPPLSIDPRGKDVSDCIVVRYRPSCRRRLRPRQAREDTQQEPGAAKRELHTAF